MGDGMMEPTCGNCAFYESDFDWCRLYLDYVDHDEGCEDWRKG